MWDGVAIGLGVGFLAHLTAGPRQPAEPSTAATVPVLEYRLDCFAVGLLVGLLSSLPTIFQTPSQSIGPGLLAAFAAFTTLGDPRPPLPWAGRSAMWAVRGLVSALAIFAGWLMGT